MVETKKDDLFNFCEVNCKKDISTEEVKSVIELIADNVDKPKNIYSTVQPPISPPDVGIPSATNQQFEYNGSKFPMDGLTILLIAIVNMKNSKADEVLKSAGVVVYDVNGKKIFPRKSAFKEFLRKLLKL